ncbi:MAG TPA: ABC transporter ATP-binding protein [Vicinamibacterales bacterium]|nr:ABC transporter ATP-binding protein [Vicinamibacterales bacterium]
MELPAIETASLSKRYGRVRALEDLSLTVQAGEIFGFLGQNGAGKTTTIRLLLGLIAPSSGRAAVLGHDVSAGSAWRRDVGYLPGTLTFWPRVSGARTLDMLAAIGGRPAVWRQEVIERLHLSAADLSRPVGSYSDGMRQKLGIAQALQCGPRLALLDEPSKGLDPLMQIAFYDLLFDLAKKGTTIFFSSHVLPEVERVCQRVAMLRAGRLLTVGSVDDLRRTLPRRVTVVFRDEPAVIDLSAFGQILGRSGTRIELMVSADRVPELASRLAAQAVRDLLIEPQRLEDAFLEQYR